MCKEFLFKERIAGRGYYCRIVYEVNSLPRSGVVAEISNRHKWQEEIAYAVNYFSGKFPGISNPGLHFYILDIHDMIVDTTYKTVFYAMVMILQQETGWVIPGFGFDATSELIKPN